MSLTKKEGNVLGVQGSNLLNREASRTDNSTSFSRIAATIATLNKAVSSIGVAQLLRMECREALERSHKSIGNVNLQRGSTQIKMGTAYTHWCTTCRFITTPQGVQ